MTQRVLYAPIRRVVLLCLLSSGCMTPEIYPSSEDVYWDQPQTGWYWVGESVEPAAIAKAANECVAKVDGSVVNHGVVPPGFSANVFHFVGDNSQAARDCTVERLSAVPQLTIYSR